MREKRLTLEELDAIPYVSERGALIQSKIIEREEQEDAVKFIPPHSFVLELGGRYGLLSAVINHCIDNPTQHIVVEPDPTIQAALKKNRESHFCDYSIFHGVVSRQQMYFTQHQFSSYCTPLPNDTPVPCVSLEELQEKFQIKRFTHVVADCEGGLIDFFEENKEFFTTLEGVYVEKDNKIIKTVDYEPFFTYLKEHGFTQKKEGFREYWERKT